MSDRANRSREEEEAITKVEDFIQHQDDGDIEIDSQAGKTFLDQWRGRVLERKSLADILFLVKDMYEQHRNDKYCGVTAKVFAQWIEKARFYGVIKEGSGLSRKLRECNEEKEQLQKEVTLLSERNLELEFENKDLQARLDQVEKMQDPIRRQNQ